MANLSSMQLAQRRAARAAWAAKYEVRNYTGNGLGLVIRQQLKSGDTGGYKA